MIRQHNVNFILGWQWVCNELNVIISAVNYLSNMRTDMIMQTLFWCWWWNRSRGSVACGDGGCRCGEAEWLHPSPSTSRWLPGGWCGRVGAAFRDAMTGPIDPRHTHGAFWWCHGHLIPGLYIVISSCVCLRCVWFCVVLLWLEWMILKCKKIYVYASSMKN